MINVNYCPIFGKGLIKEKIILNHTLNKTKNQYAIFIR